MSIVLHGIVVLLLGIAPVAATNFSSVTTFAAGYRTFISSYKIASEVAQAVVMAVEKKGTRDLPPLAKKKIRVEAGSSFYYNPRPGVVALIRLGSRPLTDGVNLIVSHTDAPRLMLKPNSVESMRDVAFLSCNERGITKIYQWFSRPLSIRGSAYVQGMRTEICMGEYDGYSFIIPDMGEDAHDIYGEYKGRTTLEQESPALLAGSIPLEDEVLNFTAEMQVRKYLQTQFGLTERSLLTAQLDVVPAGEALDVGLQNRMIGGYGHDGRAGCYAALQAFMHTPHPQRTSIILFVQLDPLMEHNSGALLTQLLQEIFGMCATVHGEEYTADEYRGVMKNTRGVVAEVVNGVNPLFAKVNELGNAAFMGSGVAVMKHVGWGGKYYGNDASAEYMGYIRNICVQDSITWQSAEFGKVDEGGGSSLSRYVAELGIDVVDIALPILSMHSPFALVAKSDLYEAQRFYRAFLVAE